MRALSDCNEIDGAFSTDRRRRTVQKVPDIRRSSSNRMEAYIKYVVMRA